MAGSRPSLPQTPAHDEATLSFYATDAPVYTASGPGGVSRHLPEFLERLSPHDRILELGCGGGRDSEEILARGFRLDPTDGVPQIARKAERRIGRPVRVMRFEDIDAIDVYDAVWANACLLHVPRPALPGVVALVFRALKPGGFHFASFKAGGRDGRDGTGRYFNHLTADEVQDAYGRAAGWELLSLTEYLGGGYEGGQGPWVGITVRKPIQ